MPDKDILLLGVVFEIISNCQDSHGRRHPNVVLIPQQPGEYGVRRWPVTGLQNGHSSQGLLSGSGLSGLP